LTKVEQVLLTISVEAFGAGLNNAKKHNNPKQSGPNPRYGLILERDIRYENTGNQIQKRGTQLSAISEFSCEFVLNEYNRFSHAAKVA